MSVFQFAMLRASRAWQSGASRSGATCARPGQHFLRQPIERRPRAGGEIGRCAFRRPRRAPGREQCILHVLARRDLVLEERTGERGIDAGLNGALFDRREQGRFARPVLDGLVIRPFPARDRFGEREALRRERHDVGEGGVVAVCPGGMRRRKEGDAERGDSEAGTNGLLHRNDRETRAGRTWKTRRIDEDSRAA
ncbi:hypothetical protein BA763_20510 [Burkholderia cenocepacia]|nr:hypothetical protein BA763_20510 [Burkholderia cenocepacia]